jgi:hypothetical protein
VQKTEASELEIGQTRAFGGVQRCTIEPARPCLTARSYGLALLLWPRIVHGTPDALGRSTKGKPKNWKTMGTELLTVGISVLLFGLCALFVRICDRI